MARRTNLVVATTSFWTTHGGSNRLIHKGDVWEDSSVVVRADPKRFRPLVVNSDTPERSGVEQATAAPGELRGER